MTIKQFSQLLITKYGCLESEFSEVYVAFMLIFTLPIIVASVESFFSKLKMIKNYRRNIIELSRLNNFGLLAIEHKQAAKLDAKSLIN